MIIEQGEHWPIGYKRALGSKRQVAGNSEDYWDELDD